MVPLADEVDVTDEALGADTALPIPVRSLLSMSFN